jgi:hypothetical protein
MATIVEIARWRRPEIMSDHDRKAEEEWMKNASLERRQREISAVNFHRRRGMSRKKLIETYGDELVDAVLGYDPFLA